MQVARALVGVIQVGGALGGAGCAAHTRLQLIQLASSWHPAWGGRAGGPPPTHSCIQRMHCL